MYPEVETYIKERDAAQKEYDDWHAEAYGSRPSYGWGGGEQARIYNEWEKEFYDNDRDRSSTRRAKHKAAWEKLQESTHADVRWMTKVLKDYQSYVETVLPELPATRERLDEIADENSWCGEYEEIMGRAERAGVVPPYKNSDNDVSELVEWIAAETDEYPRRYRSKVQTMVDKIVAKAIDQERARVMEGMRKMADHVPLAHVL